MMTVLTNKRLPLAGSPRVTRDGKVGLKTELSGDGGHHLTAFAITSERSTLEEGLYEELVVESAGGRVEGASLYT